MIESFKKRNKSVMLLVIITLLFFMLPYFHPEKLVLSKYYWQVDFLMHYGYLLLFSFFVFFSEKQAKLLKVLTLLSFAVLIEMVQYFIPGRSVTLMDLMSNVLGVGSGLVVARLLNTNTNKKILI